MKEPKNDEANRPAGGNEIVGCKHERKKTSTTALHLRSTLLSWLFAGPTTEQVHHQLYICKKLKNTISIERKANYLCCVTCVCFYIIIVCVGQFECAGAVCRRPHN